ncbi:hypothetical protein Fmac_008585 [Flemingia macrophylla]|uniref:GINS subunit domain-containing protein n=1 Tax=Flemingia macrophylla TaxID=520843 RepID=A0ABD1MXU6_9FABA
MAKYYDIDDISIEEEHVLVTFQKAASGVGIDPGSESDFWHRIPSPWNLIIAPDIILSGFQIEIGSKVELPFWLAHELKLRQYGILS